MPAIDLLPYLPAAILGAVGWLLVSWVRGQERRVSAIERRLDEDRQAADESFNKLALKMDQLGEAFSDVRERLAEVAMLAKMLRDRDGRR